MTHICVGNLTINGSDNGLSLGRHQAIIWTNAGILFIRTLGTYFSEDLIEILTFSFKKMRLKVSSAKWRPFCHGLNVLRILSSNDTGNGLVPKKQQAIIWINDDLVYWRIYVSPGVNVFKENYYVLLQISMRFILGSPVDSCNELALVYVIAWCLQWPLTLTNLSFNPSMDK